MGFIRNFREDRNAGKVMRDQQRAQDAINNVHRSKEKQKEVDEIFFKLGVEKSKQARFARQDPKTTRASKPKVVNKGGNSYHAEFNGAKVEEANGFKFEKTPKSSKPAGKAQAPKSKPKK